MKRILLTLMVGFALIGASSAYGAVQGAAPGQRAGVRADVDIGFFYDYLTPFGSWVEFSPWGYIWCPAGVGFGWNPYSYGNWLWTDDGWFWDSDYEWGWAPFHYGRWGFDDDLGWFWVPGITWGPAWVAWSWNDDFVGWAPIPPGVEFEAGIGFSGVPEIPFRSWCFVDGRHFLDRDLDRQIMPFERNRTILANVSNRVTLSFQGGRVFNAGIRVDDVRRWTGREIPTYRVENGDRPGARIEGQNAVRVYRPGVTRNEGARPKTFLPREEAVKRVPEMRGREMGRPTGREPERATGQQAAPTRRQPMTMQERHNQESQAMQQSQQRERQAMMERQKKEAAAAASEAERQRINQDYQKKQQEMQKRHTEEQNQMSQRHQQERQQSGQGQQPPPKPPKKK